MAGMAGGGAGMAGTAGMAGGGSGDACPHAGTVSYELVDPGTWPAGMAERVTEVMDEAVWYYNCYSDLSHDLRVSYNGSVSTADGNPNGSIRFGPNPSYQVVPTAMHEIGHTLGVGYYPWAELLDAGRWVGPAVVELMTSLPPEQRDPDEYSQRDYITCDGQHFWPYGLNASSEHQSEWSLINHVRIVAAMNVDKASYLAGPP